MVDFIMTFFVGLLVIAVLGILSTAVIFLFPLVLAAGFLLKWLISVLFVIAAVWFVGKIALLAVGALRKKKGGPPQKEVRRERL